MSEPITQEKAEEYQQVSALVCLDLDLLLDMAERDDLTADQLRGQIRLVHKHKETAIHDPAARRDRYGAACQVFSAVAAGLVQSVAVSEQELKGRT